MKNIFSLLALVCTLAASSQNVGINTTTPASTLQVAGNPTSTTLSDGITIPTLTGDQLKAKDAVYTSSQLGTLLYVTAPVGTASAKTVNVTSSGFYFFNGSLWQRAATSLTADSTNDAFINDAANTMVKLATRADGQTSRAAGSDFVIKDDGKVGIGTVNPSVPLDVIGKIAATDQLLIRRNNEGGEILLQGQTNSDSTWTIDQVNNNSAPRLRIFPGNNESNGINIRENGNVSSLNGWIRGYATGQLLNSVFIDDPALINNNISNTSFVDLISYTYTPVYNNSKIMVQYHNSNYSINGSNGTTTDEFQSRILVGAVIPTINTQTLGVGGTNNTYFRSGTLFPISGVQVNSALTPLVIKIQVQRSSGDDALTFNGTNGTLIIQEIAN